VIKRLRVGTLKVAVMCVGSERKGDPKRAMGLSPFRGFWDMQSQMNRMFNEMLGNLGGQSPARQLEGVTEWAPAVDATTKDGNLIIRAELPGVKPEDVDISLHENVLTISGERKAEQEEQRGGYYIRERRYGSFSRSFSLPQGTDESKVRARFEHGVLEVTVEGAAVVEEPKRIQIEGPSS
jgi:HSP20 family protein